MPNDRPTLCIETPPDGEYPNESLTVSTGPSSPRSPNRRCRWGRPPGTTVIGGRGWPFADRPRSSIDTSDRKVLVNNQQDPYPGSSVGWANPLGPRPGSGRAGGSTGSPTRLRRSFRIAGIRVGASWSALLLGAIFALSFHSYASMSAAVIAGGDTSMVLIVATIVCAALMVASLLAHELAHAVVARRQGVEVSDIRLWAFGGVARILDRPASPRSQALIAGAGPAVSLALVAIFGAVAVGISGDAVGTTAVLAVACWWLAFGNLGLALGPCGSTPMATAMSWISLLANRRSRSTSHELSTLPRSGRIACVSLLRAIFALPPALSPSTRKSSLTPRSRLSQSVSLPGSTATPELLRFSTFCPAFRLMVGIWLRLQFGPGQATSGAGARWLPAPASSSAR